MAARDSCTFGKLGKRTGMLLLSFLGFLFILPLCTNTAIDPQDGTINPIYDICDNGVPDVVFTAPDETHWLLKGDHSFEIDIERENASDAMRIAERWLKLPGYVDLAFTLTGVEWSAVNDRTIFVRGDHYYVFKNYEYESESKTNHWFENRIGASPNEAFYDQVLYQKEDAVISFRHKKMLHLYETAMLFDDARRPERLQVYRVTAALHPTVRSILDSSQAYYFVPSVNATFHLYFQSGDEGFFCFLSAFNSPCSPMRVTSMFDCPPELQVVRKKHFLGSITNQYRITTDDFILCVLGAAIGVVVVLISLLLPVVSKYRTVCKIHETQLALQEEQD